MALILKVISSSLFRLVHTFTVMFGSPSTRELSSLTTIIFFWFLFIWQQKFRTRSSYNFLILIMCAELGLGPLPKLPKEIIMKYKYIEKWIMVQCLIIKYIYIYIYIHIYNMYLYRYTYIYINIYIFTCMSIILCI